MSMMYSLVSLFLILSFDIPLVDQVVDPVPSSLDPTLSLESEEQLVHPTLPLESEVKVVESMAYSSDPTLSSESGKKPIIL